MTLHPFVQSDLAHLLASRAALRSEHAFIIWEPFEGESKTWTYGEFHADVMRFAAGLKARGVSKGDRVLIHLENCPEFILAWFACVHIGAVAVTTNTKSVASELEYLMSFAGVVGAITQPKFASLVSERDHKLQWIAVTETDAGSTPSANTSHFPAVDDLMGDPLTVPLGSPDPMHSAAIQFTSGTTSRPKGVVWTHANALWGGKVSAMHENLTADDIHLIIMPLFHTNALSYSLLATLWAGATAVVQPRYSASRFWDVSLRNKCTWVSMDPFCIRTLMQQEVPEHSYRHWGTPFAEPKLEKHFGVRFVSWWGMTETITHGIVSDPFEPSTTMSMGRPATTYGVAVLGDDGSPVAAGETGDLKIKGVPGISLFKEYLKNPEATAKAFDEDGWFITGDRVTLLENGDIAFADRDKDVLKVGGENVSASEVERIIMAVPGVSECAVVAKPDELRVELPVAFVIPQSNEYDESELIQSIQAACETDLASFKRPVEFHLVDSMPRSTLGKIAKAKLREGL